VRAAPENESAGPPKSHGKGKGKGKGKGHIRRDKDGKMPKFQIKLGGAWENYGPEEDAVLKRAFLVGYPTAKFTLRGQSYEYSFKTMTQKNIETGKEREIRPPYGMRAPSKPLIPPGSTIIVTVPAGAAGQNITVNDPNNPGQTIQVAVPPGARPGSKMAVPVPEKGETVEALAKRNQGWSTGAKVAAVGVAGGALAVGGVILGDHLTGGAMAEAAAGAAEDMGPGLDAAGDWIAGAAEDAGTWAADAADPAADWASGAAEDAGEWASVAVDDVGDWLGGAADDVGDLVMSLF